MRDNIKLTLGLLGFFFPVWTLQVLFMERMFLMCLAGFPVHERWITNLDLLPSPIQWILILILIPMSMASHIGLSMEKNVLCCWSALRVLLASRSITFVKRRFNISTTMLPPSLCDRLETLHINWKRFSSSLAAQHQILEPIPRMDPFSWLIKKKEKVLECTVKLPVYITHIIS